MYIDIVKPPTKDKYERTQRALNWAQTMFLLPPRHFGLSPVGKLIEVQQELSEQYIDPAGDFSGASEDEMFGGR